jgi:hypothetical protein
MNLHGTKTQNIIITTITMETSNLEQQNYSRKTWKIKDKEETSCGLF